MSEQELCQDIMCCLEKGHRGDHARHGDNYSWPNLADVSEMADAFCTCGISDPKTFGHRHDCAAVDEKKQLRARAERAEAAANRLLMEKDQWHDSARVAEAELARQRPVVDAAEALVEGWKPDVVQIESNALLLHQLGQDVKEAQRDG